MRWAKFINLDCSKAENYCDKQQYNEARLFEKIKLRVHLLFCETCQKYTSKNSRLTNLVKKASIKTCTKKEKEKFKRKIQRHL